MINLLTELTITTQRLRLRRIAETDLKQIYQIHSDPEVNRYLPYHTWKNWSDAESWLATILQRRANNEAEQFVIETQTDNTIVGTCIVFGHDANKHSLELGYVLAKNAWKKGFMFEALLALLPELAKHLALKYVCANVEKENISSVALLEKLEFVQTGIKTDEDGTSLVQLAKVFC